MIKFLRFEVVSIMAGWMSDKIDRVEQAKGESQVPVQEQQSEVW